MNPPPSAPATSPEGAKDLEALRELALDLRWTWNHGSDALWKRLDPALWDQTQHPDAVLRGMSQAALSTALADPGFHQLLESTMEARRHCLSEPTWFAQRYPTATLTCVAYFCMEFMLSEALPIYSGGLGNVAGDQLKAASDLGIPVVGVGLLYQHGYFRQVIDPAGCQQALYPYNDPAKLPVTPVLHPGGGILRLELALTGYSVWLRAWSVLVGRRRLYLLDTNDEANAPELRGITSELYGGGPEVRLQQEIILGIGGWRLLAALGIKPEVCHLNEGHAAFALLERARSFMKDAGASFDVALAATRTGNLFTTHTAVAAGFDLFPPYLIGKHLASYATELQLSLAELLAMGHGPCADPAEPFNMAYLAFRGSGAVNGVSELHGLVSRHIFSPLFPRWPEDEVPVGHVTNGVHMPTWDSAESDALWTEACGKGRWLGMSSTLEADVRRVSDDRIWALRVASRRRLVAYAQHKLEAQLSDSGVDTAKATLALARLRPDVLTLGFARRFAEYKRPNLLLHDPARLTGILKNAKRPAQLILAGKAHPADLVGQALIQQWVEFIRHSDANPPVVFLADYDMRMAEHLVQGVDVWINTPRRPWEASGTSGMKVLVNGGLNLSELDGWWAEAYRPQVGWALGDGREHGNDPAWDAAEAEALYERLEQDVIPEFYARDAAGMPRAWLSRIRESMAVLTPQFSAHRTVTQYTETHYLPACDEFEARARNRGSQAQSLVEWCHSMPARWPGVHFGSVTVETRGAARTIGVEAFLGSVAPGEVSVELYAMGQDGGGDETVKMTEQGPHGDAGRGRRYTAVVSSAREASDYTARIVPRHDGIAVPLEFNELLWQK